MKLEKSCGAVIYKIEDQIYYLLIHQKKGHYGFPKGHVEGNENEEQTAKREIREETNLDVNIDNNFREQITYSPYEGIIKDVIYFIATPISDEIKPQEAEVSEIIWCTYGEAYQLLTHEASKNILKKAQTYLSKK